MSYYVRPLEFNTRKEIEEILDKLRDVAECYGYCTVQDLYDLAGLDSCYKATEYGWLFRDLGLGGPVIDRVSSVSPYVLNMPAPYPINETDEQNKQKHKYVSYNQKKEDINILVRVAEMENTYDAMLVINDIIQANRGRKINITIE